MCRRKKKKKDKQRKGKENKEIVRKLYTLGISGEIFMISRLLKVDVVLEDLIALGKEIKIVTIFHSLIKSSKLLYFALNYL